MAKQRPAEFPTDWHYEAHLEALARELAGREARLAELEAMPDHDEVSIEQTKGEISAVKAQLAHYGVGQQKAAKRPTKAKESRAKK